MGIIYTIAEVTETLDKAIRCIEDWNSNRHLNNIIVLEARSEIIAVEKGIREMADALGVELQYEKSLTLSWYHFQYNGYTVTQFEEHGHEQ